MELHHSKHHQTYVNGLNAAEEAYFKAPSIRDKIALQAALKFNGGGEPPLSKLVLNLFIIAYRPHQPHTLLEEPRTGQGRRRQAQGRQA
jgi:superoxide dismutase